MQRPPPLKEMKEALHWEPLEGKKVRCMLCPHRCIINPGRSGVCGVRWNVDGRLYTEIYGKVTALAVDPIEKKPLYHFYPGRGILSVSSYGCNFRCLHCQNWELSQEYRGLLRVLSLDPEELLRRAVDARDSVGVAFTYNEPLIWYEYLREALPLLRENGQHTVLVTNGYINPGPLEELLPHISASNVDVKGFSEEFYRKVVGGSLQPVLDTVKRMKSAGVHVEITYLVIPTLNDDEKQVRGFIEWVMNEVGERTVVHFTRFHPDYRLTHLPPTPLKTLERIYSMARDSGLKFVYLGNVPPGDYDTTYCPSCGTPVIRRDYFWVTEMHLKEGRCIRCGERVIEHF